MGKDIYIGMKVSPASVLKRGAIGTRISREIRNDKEYQGHTIYGCPRKNTYYIYEKASLTIVLSPHPRQG
jgi:hypothetical protein